MAQRAALVVKPEEFRELFRELMRESEPEFFPLVPGGDNQRVTIARVAAALAFVSPDHLRKIVSGRANITSSFVERLDAVFQLRGRGVVRQRLYQTTLGFVPTHVRAEESAAAGSEGARLAQVAAVFDNASYPLYISGPTWDIVYYNKEFNRWWPTAKYTGNIMRCIMLDLSIRANLVEWEQVWVAPVITQLRAALTLMPEVYHERLADLIEEVTAGDRTVRSLWLANHILEVNGDGSMRIGLCPHGNPCTLRLVSFSVDGLSLHRFVELVPLQSHPCCFPGREWN